MKIKSTLEDHEDHKNNPERRWMMLRRQWEYLARVVNYHIGFGDGTSSDNVDGTWINVTSPNVANTDFTVNHNLQRIPAGYHVWQKSAACDVYTGAVAATSTQLTLRATQANVTLRIFVA